MQTYLFYDIETTGLSKVFDQILHFAAIRTDMQLNEIERYELKIKLNPDVIPSPDAMIIHRMRLSDIHQGVSEYAAIKQIHQWMNQPNTISLGYNTLKFDDEFLRFSFYRNLLSPYTHQYANNCSRMDIYPMTIMYYLFKNTVVAWPIKDEKISLKLEALNQANQFMTDRSHHAMVDVEVTLALARKFLQEDKMWGYLRGYFIKNTDQYRLQRLASDTALMILGKLGSQQFYQSQVLSIGQHYHYTNQFLWLRLDESDFSAATKETLTETTHVIRKKFGEPGFLLPLEERYMRHLDQERIQLANANLKWLHEHADMFQLISNYHRAYKYPVFPETDIDADLYLKDFWTAQEDYFCRAFHAASPTEKSKMLENVESKRLYNLGVRILGRHFPECLDAKQAEDFSRYVQKINAHDDASALIDYKGESRLTPVSSLKKMADMRLQMQLDHEQLQLLDELESYLRAFTN